MSNPLPLILLIGLAVLSLGMLPFSRNNSRHSGLATTQSTENVVAANAAFNLNMPPDPCFRRTRITSYDELHFAPEFLVGKSLFQCGRPDGAPPLERNRVAELIRKIRRERTESAV